MSSSDTMVKSVETWVGLSMRHLMGEQLALARSKGLSMPQIGLLNRVKHVPASINELGEEFGVSGAAASQMIDRLVQLGLVSRSESPHDRRVKMIELTSQGIEVVHSFVTATHGWLAQVAAGLSEAEQDQINSAFLILNKRIEMMPAPEEPAMLSHHCKE
ncbi:MAG: MarR family winged helix-turn-helix transcriptional regulator [Anaerolineae bacterium]